MDSSFQVLEKTSELHNRIHYRKSPEKDHNSFFDIPSQPAGNLATQRLLRSGVIRPKLTVSQPGDPHEQEADRVAQQVISIPTLPSTGTGQASAQRQTLEEEEVAQTGTAAATITPRSQHAPEEEDEIQTKALAQRMPSHPLGSFEPGADFEARLSSGGGSPLPASTRAFMEPRFGADFSGVRLHTGGEAAQLTRAVSAQAFTHGQDIYLSEGKNNLESSAGKQLLAHELTHTIQQNAAQPGEHGSERPLSRSRDCGLCKVNRAAALAVQRDPISTSAIQSQAPVQHVPWTGDPVSMANAMRNLLLSGNTDRIADSLGMLWVRGMVDTLRMLKLDVGTFAVITGAARFRANNRLMTALDVVEGRSPAVTGLFPDQAIEFRAMHDVADWPKIIGPQAPPMVLLPRTDAVPDPVLSDPRYYAALYDAIRRNRAMAGQYLLRAVKARATDRVPGGFVYVGPSHKGDRPSGLDVPEERRKAVNEALWKELGVGEGTQASINTWDSAKFTFGPGFAATGLLRRVMDNLAKSGSEVLVPLRNAGLIFEKNTWYVVDPDSQSVKSGKEALDVLSKDVGLLGTFLDTAGDPAMRREWMEAEWQAMRGSGGAAAVPDQVVKNWPVELIIFVAHCVHWGGTTWKNWDSETPPSLFHVVRKQAGHVPRQHDDPRILTLLSASTFLSFSGGLLLKTMRERGRPINLPEDWKTGFVGAVALPVSATTPGLHIIEANEN